MELKHENVMIDIETMGTGHNAAVIAIGAVRFDPDTGDIDPDAFYMKIDKYDADKHGVIDLSTLEWWDRQSEEARIEAFSGAATTYYAANALSEWLNISDKVWGNGACFDITVLESMFKSVNCLIPWKFWNVRDCRTVEAMAYGLVGKGDIERKGTHHNALDDAIYQASYISAMWMRLRQGAAPRIDVGVYHADQTI